MSRAELGLVRVMVAGPGSGKTYLCMAQLAAGRWGVRVSLDETRAMFGCGPHDQKATPKAVAWTRQTAHLLLAQGHEVTVDATGTTPQERETWLSIAAAHDVPAVAEILRVPLAVAAERNDGRPYPVPEEPFLVKHMRVAALTRTELLAEGFVRVTEHIDSCLSPA